MEEMVQLVSYYFGAEVPARVCEAYQEAGMRKLGWIISREGDADGERLKPYYLAQLIAEAIKSDFLTKECFRRYEDKKRAASIADDPRTQPHYSTRH